MGYTSQVKQEKGDQFPYSDYLLTHKDIFKLEEEGIYFLNFPAIVFDKTALLNKEGVVQIGNSLYQYTEDAVKVIYDGDYRKLEGLPNTALEDKDRGIFIIETREEEIQLYNEGNARFDGTFDRSAEWRCSNTRGKDKVIGKVKRGWTYAGYSNGQLTYSPYVYATAENFRKGVFGWNRKRTRSLAMRGTVTASSIGPLSGVTVNIDAKATALTRAIDVNIWPPVGSNIRFTKEATPSGTTGVHAEGEVTVFGRGGTSCTI